MKHNFIIITTILSAGNISVITCAEKFSPYATEQNKLKVIIANAIVLIAAIRIFSNYSGTAVDCITGITIPIPSKE